MKQRLFFTNDLNDSKYKTIDSKNIFKFPSPCNVKPFKNICLVTKEIPLQLLYSAYMQGIFPWFNEDEGDPVLWYSPEPRFCICTNELHIPKSVEKFLKKTPYTYTMDLCFSVVVKECANMLRKGQDGTWIGQKIITSYTQLHEAGYAHSFEVWHNGSLVGGFYGVLLGSVFCGESMFTKEPNSSKSAFAFFAKAFTECGGKLIDSQVYTENIARYGAKNISRDAFLHLESKYINMPLTKDLKATYLALAD